jgi:tRNA A58 N-methylase Trm61
MSTISQTDATYVMGHPIGEEERLQKLGQLLYPSTRHLFEKAGIAPGMKVLDVGSGAGDVALLLAELVGPEGAIVGVDVYPAVLEAARVQVQAAGLTNVTFMEGDIRNVALDDDTFAPATYDRAAWWHSRRSSGASRSGLTACPQ